MAESIETRPFDDELEVVNRPRRKHVGSAMQVAGGASVTGAAFGVNHLLGWLTAGVCLIVFGVATELGGN